MTCTKTTYDDRFVLVRWDSECQSLTIPIKQSKYKLFIVWHTVEYSLSPIPDQMTTFIIYERPLWVHVCAWSSESCAVSIRQRSFDCLPPLLTSRSYEDQSWLDLVYGAIVEWNDEIPYCSEYALNRYQILVRRRTVMDIRCWRTR